VLLVLHVRITLSSTLLKRLRAVPPLPRQGKPHRPTLRPLDVPRGPPRSRRQDASHRCLQPTFPTRAPNPRPPDSRARYLRRGDRLLVVYSSRLGPSTQGEHGVGPPFGNPAPGRTTLDGAAPASACSITFLPAYCGRTRAPPEGEATSARLFRPRLRRMTRPLAPSVAPRILPELSLEFLPGTKDRFHRPASTGAAFPARRRLSSTRASPTLAGIARHRSRDFAAAIRLPALVRPPDALAGEG
jgi:hypothetical protein